MGILDAAKKAKEKLSDNDGLADNLVFTCILRNLGVSLESCVFLESWDIDEREDIIKHAELGFKFYFEE